MDSSDKYENYKHFNTFKQKNQNLILIFQFFRYKIEALKFYLILGYNILRTIEIF